MFTKIIQSIVSLAMILFVQQSFGYAHTYLMIENNCSTDATFTITDDAGNDIYQKTIKPYEYVKTKEILNDNFLFSRTSNFDINYVSKNSSGSVKYELSNDFVIFGEKGANQAVFKDAEGNIEINHRLDGSYEYIWTNYSVNPEMLVKGNLIKPTFTVSACHKEINTSNSLLSGVKRVLIFGDSLSDRGNLYAYSLQLLPKSTPYYRGMFSNGAVWSEQFAKRLSLNNISVSNYAVVEVLL